MAKIMLIDIETSPLVSYIWSMYSEVNSTKFITNEWYVLSWAAKELGKKKVLCKALCDYKEYKKDSENDKYLLEEIRNILDDTDIVIWHNGNSFDMKKLYARFIYHNIPAPSPFKSIDTLIEARRYFKFTSNRLNDLGQYLKVGKKVDTGGFELWKQCLAGVKSAWNKMKRYNKMDVVLLEKVYLKLRPYMKNHPNIGLYSASKDTVCPKCGSKNWIFRGNYMANVTSYKRIWCKDCGGWSRTRIQALTKEKRKSLIVNAI